MPRINATTTKPMRTISSLPQIRGRHNSRRHQSLHVGNSAVGMRISVKLKRRQFPIEKRLKKTGGGDGVQPGLAVLPRHFLSAALAIVERLLGFKAAQSF